ncbi:hypothetical protein G6F65_020269 [Rhizopus arrhizus]|nr:hypothetical protein G6F65_020269 [Rhizopus arrhizus]
MFGVARQAGDAVEHFARLVDRPGKIRRHLASRVVADLHFHLVQRFLGGPLADHVDHAARPVLPIQHRLRPAQHFDALGPVDLGLPDGPAVVVAQLQTVQVVAGRLRVKAPDDRPDRLALRRDAPISLMKSADTTEIDCGVSRIVLSVFVPVALRLAR